MRVVGVLTNILLIVMIINFAWIVVRIKEEWTEIGTLEKKKYVKLGIATFIILSILFVTWSEEPVYRITKLNQAERPLEQLQFVVMTILSVAGLILFILFFFWGTSKLLSDNNSNNFSREESCALFLMTVVVQIYVRFPFLDSWYTMACECNRNIVADWLKIIFHALTIGILAFFIFSLSFISFQGFLRRCPETIKKKIMNFSVVKAEKNKRSILWNHMIKKVCVLLIKIKQATYLCIQYFSFKRKEDIIDSGCSGGKRKNISFGSILMSLTILCMTIILARIDVIIIIGVLIEPNRLLLQRLLKALLCALALAVLLVLPIISVFIVLETVWCIFAEVICDTIQNSEYIKKIYWRFLNLSNRRVVAFSFRVAVLMGLGGTVILNRYQPFVYYEEKSTAVLEFVSSVLIIPIVWEWIKCYKKIIDDEDSF